MEEQDMPMERTQRTGPTRREPHAWRTILRDCGVLIAITMLCWGVNAVVGLFVYFSLPNGYTAEQMAATNVRAMDLLMTLGGLYLFASLAALLAGVVVRVLSTRMGLASLIVVAINVLWWVMEAIVRLVSHAPFSL